jgi:hypothetical protein
MVIDRMLKLAAVSALLSVSTVSGAAQITSMYGDMDFFGNSSWQANSSSMPTSVATAIQPKADDAVSQPGDAFNIDTWINGDTSFVFNIDLSGLSNVTSVSVELQTYGMANDSAMYLGGASALEKDLTSGAFGSIEGDMYFVNKDIFTFTDAKDILAILTDSQLALEVSTMGVWALDYATVTFNTASAVGEPGTFGTFGLAVATMGLFYRARSKK